MRALLLAVLVGCGGEVHYACTYTDVYPDGSVVEGEISSGVLTCRDYCEVGDQIIYSSHCASPEEGVERTCACEEDLDDGCARWLRGRSCND